MRFYYSTAESQPKTREGRVTGSAGKVRAGDEKSTVEVRRKTAKMLDYQRIGVFWGRSDRNVYRVGDQRRWNRTAYCAIIEAVACRSTVYELI